MTSGRCFSFVINASRNLRNGTEILDSNGGFKNISNKINKRIKFEIPPDRDVDGKCAAAEYWVRDRVNYFYGRTQKDDLGFQRIIHAEL